MSSQAILHAHSALNRALRAAIAKLNAALAPEGARFSDWPAERPGGVVAVSVTLERTADGAEIGEARFAIDAQGQVHFDADDAPVARCAPEACEALLAAFAARRIAQVKTLRAA